MNQKAMHTVAALLLAAFTHTLPLSLPASAAEPAPAAGPGVAVSAPRAVADTARSESVARVETSETGTKAGKRQTYPFRGKVAAIDASARTVTLEGRASRRVIRINDDTRVTRDGAAARLEEIKPGEAVGGTLRKSPEGTEVATLIRVGIKPKDKGTGAGAPDEASGPGEG